MTFWHLFLCLLGASQTLAVPTSSSDEYDFIIVGGGTAGSALATRLSQRLSNRILLIEAGPSALDELKINVPGMRGATIGTQYDWNFTTVPQAHTLNRTWLQSRGKVLGGSSAMNLLVWDRGSQPEYDSWEELGNPGWNWQSMIKYMLRAENFSGANTSTYGSRGVATGGPIDARISRVLPEQQTYFIPTLESLGIEQNLESLGGHSLGVMYQPANVNSTYVRSYAANSYLPIARENLQVLTNTMVSKVLFQETKGTLSATDVLVNGTKQFKARKEVILSAGSFQSPGLLELSGIGRPDVLKKAGVKPLLNLPSVGENLQDHVRITNNYQLAETYSGQDRTRYDTAYAARELQMWKGGQASQYDGSRTDISFQTLKQAFGNDTNLIDLAKRSLANSTSVVDRKKLEFLTTAENTTIPELEIILSDGYIGLTGYPSNTSAYYSSQFFTLISALQHPLSRGTVHITNASINAKPIINPNYLSNPFDLAVAVLAAKNNRRIAETYPLRQAWTSEYAPGLDRVETDEEWKTYTLNNTATLYHPVGTCAMLPKKDGGVVDSELRVYGTSNLRVVDASIMPVIISGHLQTAVYGIAEKAVDIIVAEHGKHKREEECLITC